MHLYEKWGIDSAGKGLSVRMLMILLSALESDEDRHKFICETRRQKRSLT